MLSVTPAELRAIQLPSGDQSGELSLAALRLRLT